MFPSLRLDIVGDSLIHDFHTAHGCILSLFALFRHLPKRILARSNKGTEFVWPLGRSLGLRNIERGWNFRGSLFSVTMTKQRKRILFGTTGLATVVLNMTLWYEMSMQSSPRPNPRCQYFYIWEA